MSNSAFDSKSKARIRSSREKRLASHYAGAESRVAKYKHALNEAVLALRATEQSMCNQPGQGMPGQQGKQGQKMGEMAREQGQLNQRSQNLTRRLSQQMTLSSNDQAEMRRLDPEAYPPAAAP